MIECSKTNVVLEKEISQLPPYQQEAVRSCLKASKLKDMRGMRYTTQWVYECLLLSIKSKKGYEHLRKRKIMILPSLQTLHKYIKNIQGSYGFQLNLFKVLSEKTKIIPQEELHGIWIHLLLIYFLELL